METNHHHPHHSFSSKIPSMSESPDANGYLKLKGNPAPWIEINPPASLLLVKHLSLDFQSINGVKHNIRVSVDHQIGDSIKRLARLTHLTVENAKSLKCLPKSMVSLQNLKSLKFNNCSELPVNLGVLKMSLTHLTIYNCAQIKFIPETLATLSKLTSLHVEKCDYLTKLPASLGQLRSLKHFSLNQCSRLRSVPNSMANVLDLDTFSIKNCSSLTELPGNLKDSVNLHHLTLDCGYTRVEDEIPELTVNLNQLVNLHMLCFRSQGFVKLPVSFYGLGELILLDIQDTTIKYLPWSITKLNKLKFLMLPSDFRLGTLPSHLNDSVLISVYNKHVRKTWKELQKEIDLSAFPIAQGPYPSTIAPPGYLRMQGSLGQWIHDNYESRTQVKMLDLVSPSWYNVEVTKNSIGKLPYLTHLFLTDSPREDCLPRTITWLKHLCLKSCLIKSYPGSLNKLSNLETLELRNSTFPVKTYLPVSLRRLSLQSHTIRSFPINMSRLYNLHTLELRGCYNLSSLPPMNIVTLKINRIIKSLPISLRHLEILHVERDHCDEYCDGSRLEHCLTQMVNLEMLSLTCNRIKSLPSLAGPRNLRELLLKDCFALKELPPDMEQLVELNTLNISGTRIKSLPDSIIKLSKLQQLTLPKCFTQKLPRILKEVSIIDDTDKRYYDYMGYFDSEYETITNSSSEGNDADVGSIDRVDEAFTENCRQEVSDKPACEQDDVIAQVPIGPQVTASEDLSDGYNDHAGCSSNNQDEDMLYISENSQQALQNEGLGKTVMEKIEQENPPCDRSNLSCSEEIGNNQGTSENGQHMLLLSDDAKNRTQKLELPQKKIQPLLSRNTRLVDAAKQLRVLRYKLKRCKNRYGRTWPSSKRRKQCHDAKIKPNTDSTCLEKPSIPAGHGHEQKMSKGAIATMDTVGKPLMETVNESHADVPQHLEVLLDGANQSNVALSNGSSISFDFVKACYERDAVWVWIDFSLTSNLDQLNESVCKKFGLEVNKFKVKYLDDDKEWLPMACVSDLTRALLHTSSSGRNFVRLSITDTGIRNTNSSSFDFVKACYGRDALWIDFTLTSSFDQLNESVSKKFGLEVNKFKIKYLGDDKEWLPMARVSDLTRALVHTSSSGRNFVRLSITDTMVLNTDSSSFDFVKACYERDAVWIDFSLTSSFDQLTESVCNKFGLDVNKFKIRYLDYDKEWLPMVCVYDLTRALLHTSSSGRNFVRLSITDTVVTNTRRASNENYGQVTAKKSESRLTCVCIQFDGEKSKCIQCTGENFNQPSKDSIPFHGFCLPRIKPLIEGYIDVKHDGNCGFRVIATFEYGDEEKWLDVRIDLLKELHTCMDLYKKVLGDEEFERANFMVNWLVSPAKKIHRFEATCLGLVVATKYQKVFTCWSYECCTYLPLVSRFFDHKPPTKYINMGRIKGNHFIALQMPTNIPLPPLSPLWKSHRYDAVKNWSTSIFRKQLDDYLQLRD